MSLCIFFVEYYGYGVISKVWVDEVGWLVRFDCLFFGGSIVNKIGEFVGSEIVDGEEVMRCSCCLGGVGVFWEGGECCVGSFSGWGIYDERLIGCEKIISERGEFGDWDVGGWSLFFKVWWWCILKCKVRLSWVIEKNVVVCWVWFGWWWC